MFRASTPREIFFGLLCILVLCLAVSAQTETGVSIKVTVVDDDLNLKAVPKFVLVVKAMDGSADLKISTEADGKANLPLPAGSYKVVSESPLEYKGKTYAWDLDFTVGETGHAVLDLSVDNARVAAKEVDSPPRRRVSQEGELFKTLRNGVVSVEGELGTGSGFIVDQMGLILTNQHVIARSNEIRIRFNDKTSVRARLLAEDAARDIAVLQANLTVCPDCQVLTIANNTADEPAVYEGERVFAIGSPLFQEKILTSGIASKIEERAIISDVSINPGNSGGPLFNSIGEVVGLTTFGVQAEGGPGIAGIVRIEQAAEILSKARESAASKGNPSDKLLPNMPEGTFPVETIKASIDVKKFPQKPYKSDIKDYQINYMTPVFKFFVSEKDRLESLKKRDKRNKQKGAVDTVDRFKNLRDWNEYAGQLKPVVEILALPEVTITGKSMFLSIVAAAGAGIPIPPDMKFKADFYQMKLMCSGEEITPLKRNKTEFGAQLLNYYKVKTRYTYAGIYTYPHEVFEPGKCGQMQLHIFSEEDIEKPIITYVSEETKARIWADFADYRAHSSKN